MAHGFLRFAAEAPVESPYIWADNKKELLTYRRVKPMIAVR